MTTRSLPVRLAQAFAMLRGTMLVAFSAFLMLAPERAMPGASVEPALSLGLLVASRTLLLGAVLVTLAIRGRRVGLAWVLVADAVLQVFDTGMAMSMGKGAAAMLPFVLGALDVCAGVVLRRAARST